MTDKPTEHLEHAIAEQQVRTVMAEYPHLPIVAEFYRGRGNDRDVAYTANAGSWFVLVLPSSLYVAVSAQGPTPLGTDIIGRAVSVDYPRRADQPTQVDLEALGASRFYVELVAAIREKAAVVEAAGTAA
ncbi:hypothetical protein FHR83_006804 [Actinoplanes campanulatus]|uniref:Uncharacterized protein n=1 Tax=Actinoplanes campanulatus TaxID=113559 RepID=A0A7W5FHW9_9ACTN|nr:hypothetical protein [Actinoplanes campanulatus]MBB3099098.1 hypothetical protein [Actinoplanes campanulatus]GGN39067.1 hypothetical protein GCM10010109_66550 [Actinoplanes campanulatus]GID40254.1 hypothetical protein Aca09nite_67600 [Actinoplanes campanulatus]